MRVLTPLYKEIGAFFMGDGWQSTRNRPILNLLLGKRQSVQKRMICMMKRRMTNPKEIHTTQYEQVTGELGENVHGTCHG